MAQQLEKRIFILADGTWKDSISGSGGQFTYRSPGVYTFHLSPTAGACTVTAFAEGTGQLLANEPSRWNLYPTGGHRVSFSSMDPGLNRQLWTARNFRAAVEDRRGRVLGTLDIRLPDPAEAVRLAAALAPEVDAKLTDPARPANQCAGYGEEAYVDPA